MFHADAVDKDGHHTVKPWEVVRFEANTTIPPKGTTTAPTLRASGGREGPALGPATLRYRSVDQGLANLLLGEKAPTVPVVET